MFSTVFKCLCFFLMVSSSALNAASNDHRFISNDTQSLSLFNSSSYPLVRALSSDNEQNSIGREVNGNVEFDRTGPINLTVPGDLVFDFNENQCPSGTFHICYEAERIANSKATGICQQFSNYCGFKVRAEQKSWFLWDTDRETKIEKGKREHVQATIKDPEIKFGVNFAPGCNPKKDSNGMIRMQIVSTQGCNVPALGAKIKYPDVPAIETGKSMADASSSSANIFTNRWWIFLILGACLLIAVLVAVILGCICYRKRRSSKKVAAPLPITVEDVAATVQEESMPPASTVAAKRTQPKTECEPTSVQKPAKTEEPSASAVIPPPTMPSAEKVPPPAVPSAEVAPPPPSKPLPPLQPQHVALQAAPQPAKSSKKRKSRYTDSLSETRKLNRLLPVENIVESLRRDSVPKFDYPLYDVITKDYMHINNRPITEYEVDILCVPIGPMFAKIEQKSTECEKELAAMGVTFDEENRIYSMSPTAREFLTNPTTPSTIIYFAFGAEYHQYVTDARNIMAKYSTPLLYAVALQPRFSVYSRRKALSYIRRTLPFIRESYTAAERTRLPYPACAIEQAFQKNPEYFLSLDGIETFSEEVRKKQKKEKDAAEAAARKQTSKKTEKDTVAAAAQKQTSIKKSKKRRSSTKK